MARRKVIEMSPDTHENETPVATEVKRRKSSGPRKFLPLQVVAVVKDADGNVVSDASVEVIVASADYELVNRKLFANRKNGVSVFSVDYNKPTE